MSQAQSKGTYFGDCAYQPKLFMKRCKRLTLLQCSAERPACRRCVLRHAPCHYTTKPGETEAHAFKESYHNLRSQATTHEEMLELLRVLPDKDANMALQSLRAGTDVSTILNRFKAGDALLQMAVSPETRFRYEFPYRSEMPVDLIPNNPYLRSLLYEEPSLFPSHGAPATVNSPANSRPTSSASDEYQSLYLKPFHAAHVIEPRLSTVKISAWTTVCDDDVLMRKLLASFLHCEYSFTAAFQKDLFLEDLASQRQDFCSSLLVNVVLGYACVRCSLFVCGGWKLT